MTSATLLEFARVNDDAAATTRKLQKQAILAAYFRALNDDDLRLAVRYAAGRAFASTDERHLNVGGALVSDVILSLLRLDPHDFHALVVRSGEIGEALSKIWSQRNLERASPSPSAENPPSPPTDGHATSQGFPLTLADLARAFDDLASTGVREQKHEILTSLFARCATGREAAYLSKIIFGDMRTGVQEGVLHYAIAEAFGRDGKIVQRCQLLVGDLGEVAVLARHDACGSASFRLFHPIQFMLATPQQTARHAASTMDGRSFFAEDKLDGIRAQVHKSGDRVAIYTRTMDRADGSFPDVVEQIARLPGDFLLDGEIVPYANGEVLPFAHIQKRLGRKVLTPKILRENPAAFIAFDILYRDGVLLMDLPLTDRRELLTDLVKPLQSGNTPGLLTTAVVTVRTAEEIDAAFCRARDCRNEGLVLKDPQSPYSPGRRGQMWLKIKTHLPTIDCVVTAAEYGHGKRRACLSDYTFAVWDRDPMLEGAELVNIGKAYSGVTDEEIRQLTELFLQLSRGGNGRVHVVEPKVVMEIAADQIQKSNRHASGYALRFPRIKRIRWDKRPEDADRLSRVMEIYESISNTARSTASAPPPPTPEATLFDAF